VGTYNSPTYRQGQTDGFSDRQRVADGKHPIGPCPPYPDYPAMYERGYRAGFGPGPAVPIPGNDEGGESGEVDTQPFTVDTDAC